MGLPSPGIIPAVCFLTELFGASIPRYMATESVPFVDTLAESLTSSSALGTASVVFNSPSAVSFFLHHGNTPIHIRIRLIKKGGGNRWWKMFSGSFWGQEMSPNVSEIAVRIGEVIFFCFPLSACFKSAPLPPTLHQGVGTLWWRVGGERLKKKLGSLVTVVISVDSP